MSSLAPIQDRDSKKVVVPQAFRGDCPVNSHNEWDPLQEVVVGGLDNAMFPAWDVINEVTVSPGEWAKIVKCVGGAGVPYPEEIVAAARKDRAEFIHILEAEGVVIRHVTPTDFAAPFATPAWSVSSGFCAANPRDPFLVIGNEIIETPMADRSRYFESWAYRPLFKEYFQAGAKWTAAPKPQLTDELYDAQYTVPSTGEAMRYIVTEFEPVFDAADCVRCGRDLFIQRSNVTNRMGIEWLQRHLGSEYRVHEITNRSPEAIHIDTTLMPLAPGKVLVNPQWVDMPQIKSLFKGWDILIAPDPVPNNDPYHIVSDWISINVLMLDEERVIVEKNQTPLIQALKDWGFKPIPCSFDAHYPFLGGFHCATLDIRRCGTLQSYF
jgi:glycine amidinotransferase